MKTKLSSVLFSTLLAASALLTTQVRAEEAAGGPPAPSAEGAQGKRQMNRRGPSVEAMREHLGLSDEQVAKIKEIFAAEAKEMQELRKSANGAPTPEIKEQAKAIREKYKAQIDAVLTPEQKAKADEARAAQGAKKGGKKAKGQDGAPPAAE